MDTHFNITSELTQELLAAGSNTRVNKIHLTNVQENYFCEVDLYIEKKLTGRFYLLKGVILSRGEVFVYNNPVFSNSENEFSLYIKITNNSTDTTGVDVILENITTFK